MAKSFSTPPDHGLPSRLSGLELPVTVKVSKEITGQGRLGSILPSLGEFAALLSTPFVDATISADDYHALDSAGKTDRDMIAGHWLPGYLRDQKSAHQPDGFYQSYLVFDFVGFERAGIEALQPTKPLWLDLQDPESRRICAR